MYASIVYLHLLGLLGFVLAHGASAAAAYALRRERGLEKVQALLSLSANTYGVMYASLLVLVGTGVVLGFMGNWWGWGWIWVSLGLLVAILVLMTLLGSNVYGAARKAAGLPYMERGKPQPALPPATPAALDAILARGQPHLLTLIGFGGLATITWLMMFKPF